MRLRLVDLRGNLLSSPFLSEAVHFLAETVVLLWNNPFTDNEELVKEYQSPSYWNTQLEKHEIRNPLHIFYPSASQKELIV